MKISLLPMDAFVFRSPIPTLLLFLSSVVFLASFFFFLSSFSFLLSSLFFLLSSFAFRLSFFFLIDAFFLLYSFFVPLISPMAGARFPLTGLDIPGPPDPFSATRAERISNGPKYDLINFHSIGRSPKP